MHLAQTAGLLAVHLAGPVKAMLYCVDDGSLSFTLQFNPSSFTLGRQTPVSPQSDGGVVYAGFSPDAGRNDTLTFETWLDASQPSALVSAAFSLSPYTANIGGSTGSILDDMKALYALTVPRMATAAVEKDARPPAVVFLWEDFRFVGVVTEVMFDVKLFDALGAARRAMVNVRMEGKAFSELTDAEDILDSEQEVESFSTSLLGETASYAAENATRSTALRIALRLV
jgi:hypothetical protein